MSDSDLSAKDAYALIHKSLGAWVSVTLENGFEDHPMDNGLASELLEMAGLMEAAERMIQRIEDKTPKLWGQE